MVRVLVLFFGYLKVRYILRSGNEAYCVLGINTGATCLAGRRGGGGMQFDRHEC